MKINYVEEVARLRSKIKYLKLDNARLSTRVNDLEFDRDKLRQHFATRFNWWRKLLDDGQTPNLPWLLHSDGLWLRTFKYWTITGEEGK